MSDDGHDQEALRAVVLEARRHLEWLTDAGVRTIEAAECLRVTPRPGTPEETDEVAARHSDGVEAPTRSSDEALARAAPAPLQGAAALAGGYALSDKGCGSTALLSIREEVGECARCKLGAGRTKLVFGVGAPDAELMFVGEGPGADEDVQGEPFVGKAGQLLTRMIEAMGFRREEVYIANVVKCRPPNNRDPEPDEIAACEPFLRAQIEAVRPKVVVALGRFAVQTLLRDPTAISRQRGRWRTYQGVKLMPTFHPAYLLRNPAEKKKAWDDLQLVMKELGRAGR